MAKNKVLIGYSSHIKVIFDPNDNSVSLVNKNADEEVLLVMSLFEWNELMKPRFSEIHP